MFFETQDGKDVAMSRMKKRTLEIAKKINSGTRNPDNLKQYLAQRELDAALVKCAAIMRTPLYPNSECSADGAALLLPCPSSSYISTDSETRQIQASPVVLLFELISDGKETTSILRKNFGLPIGMGAHVRNAIRTAMSEAQ